MRLAPRCNGRTTDCLLGKGGGEIATLRRDSAPSCCKRRAASRNSPSRSHARLVAFAQLHLRPVTPACVAVSPAIELHRIYVEASFHGKGLAADLLAALFDRAEEEGAAAVWLGVWEHNPRAIRFYQRSGFVEVGDHVFVVGTDPQRDLVMQRTF